MSRHPKADDLASLFDAVRRRRRTFLHLVRCARCAALAEEVFADDPGPAGAPCCCLPDPAVDYGPVFRRALALAKTMARVREEQVEEADELLLELLALDPPERTAAVTSGERFRSFVVAERLLAEARRRPAERQDLANLAVLLLERWDEPRQEVRDLRAEARAELADALRAGGQGEAAERELAAAAADLRESTDPQARARVCQAMAVLRNEQGRFDEAYALIDRAADLFEDADERTAQAAACLVAGRWAVCQGDLQRAAERFEAALFPAELPANALLASRHDA